jgi:hypothetical protein
MSTLEKEFSRHNHGSTGIQRAAMDKNSDSTSGAKQEGASVVPQRISRRSFIKRSAGTVLLYGIGVSLASAGEGAMDPNCGNCGTMSTECRNSEGELIGMCHFEWNSSGHSCEFADGSGIMGNNHYYANMAECPGFR